MTKFKRFYFLSALLFGLALACQAISSDPSDLSQESTPETNLFRDSFSDPDSGWDRYRGTDAITDYEAGGYQIFVNEPNTDVFAVPGRLFTDVQVEVAATKVGGPDENDFGVICRYQNEENFYFLIIGSDGFYGIGAVLDGDQQLVDMDSMAFDDAINTGSAVNQIRADCVGDRLTLSVNGKILAEVQDNRLRSGDVGLIAGTFDQIGVDILFDNFSAREP